MELEQKVTDAKLEEEREAVRCDAKLVQAVAELKSKKAEMKLASERLENLKTQIENSIVRAPTPGIVVYAHEGDWRRRQYVEEGATVRERQNLVILPDTTKMVAEMRVHEAMANKVKPGQPALIEVDTLEKPLRGTVTRRSPLPDSGSRWGNPDLKVYKTEITIHGDNADMALRPGMSATGKIFIDELRDVLRIPLQAVRRERAVNYVWLKTHNGPVARPITVGEGNSTHVVVDAGLEEGQQVYLARPAGAPEPELPQPEAEEPPTVPPARQPQTNTNTNGNGNSGAGTDAAKADAAKADQAKANEASGRRGPRQPNPAYDAFVALVKAKLPGAAAKLEANRFALFSDPELRQQIQDDPELKAASDKLLEQMRSRRGNRGGEGRSREGRGGERRSGEGRGQGRGREGRGDRNDGGR